MTIPNELIGSGAAARRVADLKPHPQQAQMFNDLTDQEIENLAKDMEHNGQLQPVEITSDGTIICGHQRVLAAKMLEWTEIDVIIRDDLEAEGDDAVEARLVEDNLNRRHLDPLEVARCYKRLKEIERCCKPGELSALAHSNLRDRIGTRLGMSGRNLDRYLRVLETPIAIQQAVSAGDITLTLAGQVAGLDSDTQHEIAGRIQAGEPKRISTLKRNCSAVNHTFHQRDHQIMRQRKTLSVRAQLDGNRFR